MDFVGLWLWRGFDRNAALVNEVAPRTHNSGHHTIEGNVCSQFEQHLRAVLNLLGDTGPCTRICHAQPYRRTGRARHP